MKLRRGQWDLEQDEEMITTVAPDTNSDTDDKTKPLKAEEESAVKSFTTTFATVLTGVANTLETAHRFQFFYPLLTSHNLTLMICITISIDWFPIIMIILLPNQGTVIGNWSFTRPSGPSPYLLIQVYPRGSLHSLTGNLVDYQLSMVLWWDLLPWKCLRVAS